MHDLEAAFGAPVLEAYGMTEAAHQMASNPLPPAARKPGSVGRGTDVQISIMDAEGKHLPTGERGEVVIKGPNVVRGYENNPEANATSFVDGWFRTGDQGVLDEDGYLTLDRTPQGADQPRRREDLAARDRRGAARASRGGRGGRASACRTRHGVKRSRRRSTLNGDATEAELLAFCKERLADFKRPKQIHITDAIPRTATGKIQRRVVAQAFAPQTHREDRHRRRRRDRRLHRRAAGAGRRRRRAVRARPAPAGDAGARAARHERRTATSRSGRRSPAISTTIGKADVVFLGVKAHGLTALAPQLAPLFGPDTVVVSTQNGIPWWYFQSYGGELDGLRLERVDPGGVIAASIEPRRVVGSLAYFATDVAEPGVIHHTEGNRISFGEPDGSKSERVRRRSPRR